MPTPTLDTHGYRLSVGKHKGTLITRAPISYLRWMVQIAHGESHWAQAELDRRGTVLPELDISHHAIDRASLRCWKRYLETRRDGEGLAAWLIRMAEAANAFSPGEVKIRYEGMIFVFEREGAWPTLKTVMLEDN